MQTLMATASLLRNLIVVMEDLDYTPQSELEKSFRLLKSGPSPPDRVWQSIHALKFFVTEK